MNVVIVPGYGDRRDYLETATRNWGAKFDLNPEIFVFGWNGEAESFDQKWEDFSSYIEKLGQTAIIGISAGASVAIRALQTYPQTVKKVVTVCGPVNKSCMNPTTLHQDYPLLEASLDQLELSGLQSNNVMTMRPLYDNVANINAMKIEGAQDKRMYVAHHAFSIGWAMFTKGQAVAEFINE